MKSLANTVVGVKELANLCDVTVQAVGSWFHRPDAPQPVTSSTRGRKWRLGEVISWRLRRMDPADSDAALAEARLQLAQTRGELETIKLAKARGETVSKEKHHADLCAMAGFFASAFDALAAEISAGLAGKTVPEIMDALNEWSLAKRRELCREGWLRGLPIETWESPILPTLGMRLSEQLVGLDASAIARLIDDYIAESQKALGIVVKEAATDAK